MSLCMDLIAELAMHEAFPARDREARLKLLVEKSTDPMLTSHWEGVIQIFRNSYRSQLWIVQKIVVAFHATPLLCGIKSVSLVFVDSLLAFIARVLEMQDTESLHKLASKLCDSSWKLTSLAVHQLV